MESAVKHVCIKVKEFKLRTCLYSGVIWDLAEIVKKAGEKNHDKGCIHKHN